jgi:2-iminobutanoate/2-iminopropanoate deaminase
VGPYSPVVRAGEWVVTSGQIGTAAGDDGAPAIVDGGTLAELRQAMGNLRQVLATEGLTLRDVKKTTLFLVSMDDLVAVNEIWVELFEGHRPARSAIGVAALPLGARVEVEAWAQADRRWSPSSDPEAMT